MTSVPIMPLNVEELLSDKKMQRLMRGGETKAFWEWFLTQMWANKAWLPCDDRVLSDMLDVDVRRWRNKYKPIFEQLLVRDIEPIVGDIYRQPKLTAVWDDVAKRMSRTKASLAHARAEKAAKAKQQPSATEPKKRSAAEPATARAAEPAAGLNQNQDKNSGSPPATNGPVDTAILSKLEREQDAVASPGLGGRSLPAPVASVEPGKGLMAAAFVPEEPEMTEEERAQGLKRFAEWGASLKPQQPVREPVPLDALGVPVSRLMAKLKAAKENGHDDAQGADDASDADRGGDQRDQGEVPKPEGAAAAKPGATGLHAALGFGTRGDQGEESEDE